MKPQKAIRRDGYSAKTSSLKESVQTYSPPVRDGRCPTTGNVFHIGTYTSSNVFIEIDDRHPFFRHYYINPAHGRMTAGSHFLFSFFYSK